MRLATLTLAVLLSLLHGPVGLAQDRLEPTLWETHAFIGERLTGMNVVERRSFSLVSSEPRMKITTGYPVTTHTAYTGLGCSVSWSSKRNLYSPARQ